MLRFLRTLPWQGGLLVLALILFDWAVHPLTMGPDRLIHDPAVYRLWDSTYMAGDWYTGMAVASGVYPFYAGLVNAWHTLHIPEEFWRLLLYLGSLATLYGSLVAIARIFTKSWLVVPIVAVLHFLIATGVNQPIWLYGPFIQIDGGLAPRSIGVALSFLALFHLLKGSIRVPAILLGLATLIHVSNSLIMFTLFFSVWLITEWLRHRAPRQQRLRIVGREALVGLGLYLIAGGWFALAAALRAHGAPTELPTEKFVWAWIYFRAPYMALPEVTFYWWIRLAAHALAIAGGWLALRPLVSSSAQRPLAIAALVGLGAVTYFFLFYLFAFVTPWLPGFQFYSLRVIYLAYFVAYLFIATCLAAMTRELVMAIVRRVVQRERLATALTSVITAVVIVTAVVYAAASDPRMTTFTVNLRKSYWRLLDTSVVLAATVPDNQKLRPPRHATFQYLIDHPEPFLAPPNWQTYGVYLPSMVSFKSFGFSTQGLPEWYHRIDNVALGDLEEIYQGQLVAGRFDPVTLDWKPMYTRLTEQDVQQLAARYDCRLFITYTTLSYPFELIAEDSDYRLYRIPDEAAGPRL